MNEWTTEDAGREEHYLRGYAVAGDREWKSFLSPSMPPTSRPFS